MQCPARPPAEPSHCNGCVDFPELSEPIRMLAKRDEMDLSQLKIWAIPLMITNTVFHCKDLAIRPNAHVIASKRQTWIFCLFISCTAEPAVRDLGTPSQLPCSGQVCATRSSQSLGLCQQLFVLIFLMPRACLQLPKCAEPGSRCVCAHTKDSATYTLPL